MFQSFHRREANLLPDVVYFFQRWNFRRIAFKQVNGFEGRSFETTKKPDKDLFSLYPVFISVEELFILNREPSVIFRLLFQVFRCSLQNKYELISSCFSRA